MKSVSLNGEWLYQIGGGEQSQVTVPFSRLPVGRSVCTRLFDMTERADRIFLKLDGITYYASVFLNDVFLGEMLPYSEYEFEITDVAREKDNVLTVELDDIGRAYGPSEGWENFGGIIRDVSLIYRNENYIKNVFFKSELWDDLGGAEVCCEMDSDCSEGGIYEIILYDGEEIVLSYQQASNEIKKIAFDDVKLWSPDTPALYSLEVTLICGDEICDTYSCKVGFKKLLCDRHRFVLNGKPLFLRGVCKHEMVADSGHCPSLEQMEKDMRMIKEMGCNFVRLVHYPHNKRILEIADRLGLMVSEEPGLWWSDTANEEIANGSQEVLRRTILRDRNHVSVAFWLCFNECMFTEQFLIDSAAICRRYDPTRLVSGANCMSDEDTLIYYNKCGFDFYTMHPYSDTFERAKRSAKILFDKPLVFTEWGGYHVYDNPHLLSDFMIEMHRLYLNNSDDGALAGAFFWFFAELNDFNRGEPACVDGVLHEGLVDKYRKPTLIYGSFCRGMRAFDDVSDLDKKFFWYEKAEDFSDLRAYRSLLPTDDGNYVKLVDLIRKDTANKGCMRKRRIERGPVLDDLLPLFDIPAMVTGHKPLVFEEKIETDEICVVGLTSPINGYPLGGKYGEDVCEMTIVYKNGHKQSITLKNGIHITTVFALNGSSRIDPVAEKAKRFIKFGYDKNYEVYVMNRLRIKTESGEIERVEFTLKNEDYLPLIYGIFAL